MEWREGRFRKKLVKEVGKIYIEEGIEMVRKMREQNDWRYTEFRGGGREGSAGELKRGEGKRERGRVVWNWGEGKSKWRIWGRWKRWDDKKSECMGTSTVQYDDDIHAFFKKKLKFEVWLLFAYFLICQVFQKLILSKMKRLLTRHCEFNIFIGT